MTSRPYNNLTNLDTIQKIFNIKNHVGLITGGCGKMGLEFAKILAKEGAQIIIADLDEEKCTQETKKIAQESGMNVLGWVMDVSKQESVKSLFKNIGNKFGKLDFMIHNVMSKPKGYYQPFENYSLSAWNEVTQTNLTGAFLCCQEAYKLMKPKKLGSIIITSSVYGIVSPDFRIYKNCSPVKNPYGGTDPLTAPAPYTASKGGLIALTKYLAVLFGPDNIRVNTFTPAGVYDNHEESFHKAYIDKVPLGRMAVWSDYNGAILFLVSEASRYMTGANLIVDGGWTAW